MLLNNKMRPAMAGAAHGTNVHNEAPRHRDGMCFSAESNTTDDFNSFGNVGSNKRGGQAPRNGSKRPVFDLSFFDRFKNLDKKTLMIIGIAALALVVVIALIVILAVAGANKNIVFEDNAYITYADNDGKYHVIANGKEVDHEFEGEVELVVSANNDFAYIVDNGYEGKIVYLLEGKKLDYITPTSAPAMEVLAFASLVPGIVVEEDDGFRLYTDGHDERIIKKSANAENFMISADASTVVYTAVPTSGADTSRRMYVYQNGSAETLKGGCVPVAVSSYGNYVYATATTNDGVNGLFVINTKDMEPASVEKSAGFAKVLAMNLKGDEIIFQVINNGANSSTYCYKHKKNGDGVTTRLGDSIITPANADPDIAIYETFKDTYMNAVNDLGEDRGVYYVGKDYTAKRIAPTHGQFSPDMKYFYFIGTTNSGVGLKQIDLTDDNYPTKSIYSDVVDFVVTEKGNVYHLDDQNTLRYYKTSEDDSYRRGLGDDVTTISFFRYANEIYYTVSDLDENKVYTSKEGSEKDPAKLDSTVITATPLFSHPNAKRSYAYYYDLTNGGWMIFYTSNGNSFNMVTSDCQSITGVEIPDNMYQ